MELAGRARHPAEPGNRDEGLSCRFIWPSKKLMVALLIPAPTDVAGASPEQ